MSKKFLSLFLLLLIFLITVNSKFLFLTITGLISESIISMSIANSTFGRIVYFSYPSQVKLECEIVQGDNVTFNVLFENIGNLNITERVEIHVKNSSLDTIASYYDDVYELPVLGVRNFSANWTPSKGTYWVIANVSYNSTLENKTVEENHSFLITKKEGIGTFRRSPGQITKTIPPGRSKIYPVEIQLWLDESCNSTTATFSKTSGIPGEWVSFSQDNLYLNPYNSTNVNITIPLFTPEGIYDNGTIHAYAENQTVDIGINITVAMAEFILNVTTPENVCQGGSVNAIINITKTLPSEDVSVNITYQITDYNLTVYKEGTENNIPISNKSVQKLYNLNAPSSLNETYYIFLVTLDYNSTLTQAYDTFKVIPCPTTTVPGGGGGGGGGPTEIKKLITSKITLNTSNEILTVITGNKTSFIASVKNIGTETVESIKISIEGIPSEWVRVFPTTTNLDIGEVEEYVVTIDIPNDATSGIYKLKVKAVDDVESNTVLLTLIIGRNSKEIADLLLKELESIRPEAKRSLQVEDCINMTTIKSLYKDAEMAFENGMKEYENKNYEGAVNWFEYALPIEKKVVDKVDITLELEVETLNSSKPFSTAIIPPFYKPGDQLQLAGTYLKEKNYEKICDPILEIKRLIIIGLVFWFVIVISFTILIMIIVIIKRKRKEEYYKEPELIIPSTPSWGDKT